MKILIVSDSHGRIKNLETVINKVSPIDLFIHLGDFEGSEDYVEAIVPCKVEMVSGNNDYFNGLDRDKIIKIGKYIIMLTHGHRYGVNYGVEQIKDIALQHGASIVMFGHTHRPLIDLNVACGQLTLVVLHYQDRKVANQVLLLWILTQKERHILL